MGGGQERYEHPSSDFLIGVPTTVRPPSALSPKNIMSLAVFNTIGSTLKIAHALIIKH